MYDIEKTNYKKNELVACLKKLDTAIGTNPNFEKLNKSFWDTFWTPTQKNLTEDDKHINNPIDHMKHKQYDGLYDPIYMNDFVIRYLSYLHFLDSSLPDTISFIGEFVKSKYLKGVVANHLYDEHIHSASYPYLYQKLFKVADKINEAQYSYRDWKCIDNFVMFLEESINSVKIEKQYANIFSGNYMITEEQTAFNIYFALLVNFIIEQILFHEAFAYFYYINESFSLYPTTKDIIEEIHRDELNHIKLDSMILKEINNNPDETLYHVGKCFKGSNHYLNEDIYLKNKSVINNFIEKFFGLYHTFIKETSIFKNGVYYLGNGFSYENRMVYFMNNFNITLRLFKIDFPKKYISYKDGFEGSNYLKNTVSRLFSSHGNFFTKDNNTYKNKKVKLFANTK